MTRGTAGRAARGTRATSSCGASRPSSTSRPAGTRRCCRSPSRRRRATRGRGRCRSGWPASTAAWAGRTRPWRCCERRAGSRPLVARRLAAGRRRPHSFARAAGAGRDRRALGRETPCPRRRAAGGRPRRRPRGACRRRACAPRLGPGGGRVPRGMGRRRRGWDRRHRARVDRRADAGLLRLERQSGGAARGRRSVPGGDRAARARRRRAGRRPARRGRVLAGRRAGRRSGARRGARPRGRLHRPGQRARRSRGPAGGGTPAAGRRAGPPWPPRRRRRRCRPRERPRPRGRRRARRPADCPLTVVPGAGHQMPDRRVRTACSPSSRRCSAEPQRPVPAPRCYPHPFAATRVSWRSHDGTREIAPGCRGGRPRPLVLAHQQQQHRGTRLELAGRAHARGLRARRPRPPGRGGARRAAAADGGPAHRPLPPASRLAVPARARRRGVAARGRAGADEEPDHTYADGHLLPGGLRAFRTPGPEWPHYSFLREGDPGVTSARTCSAATRPGCASSTPRSTRIRRRRGRAWKHLLGLPFGILCFAHGRPVPDDPKAALREVLARTADPRATRPRGRPGQRPPAAVTADRDLSIRRPGARRLLLQVAGGVARSDRVRYAPRGGGRRSAAAASHDRCTRDGNAYDRPPRWSPPRTPQRWGRTAPHRGADTGSAARPPTGHDDVSRSPTARAAPCR